MKTVGIFSAKHDLALLLDEVEHGAQIEITRNGKCVARLEPVTEHDVHDPPTTPELRLRRHGAEEIEAILADARSFRHRHPLKGLSLRELIDGGRRR